MTNAEKFREVFGYEPATDAIVCNKADWCGDSEPCKYCDCYSDAIGREEDWWGKEYKACFEIKPEFEGGGVMERWFPVSEKVAPLRCLACDKFGQLFIPSRVLVLKGETGRVRCFDGGIAFNDDGEMSICGNGCEAPREIFAWRPLPEPPKGEELNEWMDID